MKNKNQEGTVENLYVQVAGEYTNKIDWTVTTTTYSGDYLSNDNQRSLIDMSSRPWGSYKILYEDSNCKVKKITIKPGQAPSYQVHAKRDECWQIVSGIGVARINDELIDVKYGDIITVKRAVPHSISNPSTLEDLVFIEIQTGDYFGEDDIIRLEDKYGR